MRRLAFDPGFEEAAGTFVRPCEHPGCLAGGDFRAPKSRLQLHEYFWFCLEHVRAYNAAWNYYAGMNETEIEAEIRRDTVWQRPSWKLGDRHGPAYADRVRDYFGVFSAHPESTGQQRHGNGDRVHAAERRALSAREQALSVFEIDPPF